MVWNEDRWYPTELRSWCPSGVIFAAYGGIYKNQRYTDALPVQHRAYPTSLWDHPTAYGPKYTYESVLGTNVYEDVCRFGSRSIYYYYTTSPSTAWSLSWDQDAYSREMLARIGGEGTNFSSALAEADEAAGTIRDVLATMLQIRHCLRFPPGPKCARNMRKWFNKHAKARGWKRASEVSGDILAYNFGIAPLVDSLNDAYNRSLLYPLGNKTKKYVTTQKAASNVVSDRYKYEETYTGRSNVYVEYKTPYAEFIDFGDPLEWAWERIPFSFVVDWIIPVGSYIASLSVLQNVQRVVGTVSEKRTLTVDQIVGIPDGFTMVTPSKLTYKQFSRRIVDPLVMPSLFRLSGNNSVNSLTNAIALLVQQRNR